MEAQCVLERDQQIQDNKVDLKIDLPLNTLPTQINIREVLFEDEFEIRRREFFGIKD